MASQISRFRAMVAMLIVICILYFIAGGVVALIGWLPVEKYLIGAGIVGAIASVLGLMSLARPAISQVDLDNVETESLRSIAETSEKIRELETARAATREAIDTLQIQKQEMEILVRKASLSLFLREQRRLYEKRIQDEVAQNKDLESHIAELNSIDQKLNALNEEIETDPNVDLVKAIIASAKREPDEIQELFQDYPPFIRMLLRALVVVSRDLSRVMEGVVR